MKFWNEYPRLKIKSRQIINKHLLLLKVMNKDRTDLRIYLSIFKRRFRIEFSWSKPKSQLMD